MTMETWDIDRFPLEKTAITDAGIPESDAEWRTWEEAQRALNEKLPGGGYDGGRSEYDPHVWMMGKNAPSHEKYYKPEEETPSRGGYHMPGINAPWDDDLDEDEEYEQEPVDYHVMTGPVNSTNRREWTEHPYTMFEHPDTGEYNTDNAWDYFQQDHPEFNPERNISATHEVKNVHPADDHDKWHRDLDNEEDTFNNRIAPAGLRRESPEQLGHRTYRHDEPSGVVHRLWRSPYSVNGEGWHTSRYDPRYGREEQSVPWTEHPDSESEDSLGDALSQVKRNMAHVDPRG